jgi:HK97 family phage major capsid protein
MPFSWMGSKNDMAMWDPFQISTLWRVPMNKNQMLDHLVSLRDAKKAELDRIVSVAETHKRSLKAGESARFEAIAAEIAEYDSEANTLRQSIETDAAAAQTAKRYAPRFGEGVTRNESTYRKDGQHSYFRDLYRSGKGDPDAFRRLSACNEERAISTTNGGGGEFAPPMWLEDEYIKVARPGRVTANLIPTQDLPPGSDVLNVPKINTGTTVAAQAAQNTAISQTDITTTSVAAPVVTIAGGQTVSLQLLEQSPLNIDNVILSDLAAAYAAQLDTQVLTGSGTGGMLTGLTTLSGTQSVTYTQATPSLFGSGQLYNLMSKSIQLITSTRYAAPDAIIMHPRRWSWLAVQVDSQNRPAILPHENGPFNALGVQDDMAAEGHVGRMFGLPVYLDANIPTNLGAGTNQDEIIIARLKDSMLFEGQIRAEAFQQTYAQNMSVFVRLYNYASFVTSRYAPSIAVIGGTGLVAPTTW